MCPPPQILILACTCDIYHIYLSKNWRTRFGCQSALYTLQPSFFKYKKVQHYQNISADLEEGMDPLKKIRNRPVNPPPPPTEKQKLSLGSRSGNSLGRGGGVPLILTSRGCMEPCQVRIPRALYKDFQYLVFCF